MAVFSGEVTIRVKFNKIQIPVGFGMTSAIIKHRCVEQAYAISPWYQIKEYAVDNDKFKELCDSRDLVIESLKDELQKNAPIMADNETLKRSLRTSANLSALGAILLGAALFGGFRV